MNQFLYILHTMKTLIFCTLILGLTSCVPANSTNNNQPISSNDTTENLEFRAFGTEPFWSVDVSSSGIVYSSLGRDQKEDFPYVEPLGADGRFLETVRVYRLGEANNTMLIIRKANNCSDGMSDNLYPYSALFIQGDMVLEGCANKI
ncbi:COG3650 family protein [Nodularia chucula]|uniref:COG3650 family protein n=1 Tax=Nodularia chucula TaxID=3093667 RepID=UPI0039C746C4